jgi:hypothetical protein
MENLVSLLFAFIISLIPFCLAGAAFYISHLRPLPSWSRNRFHKQLGIPESFDRINWLLLGLFCTFMGLTILFSFIRGG